MEQGPAATLKKRTLTPRNVLIGAGLAVLVTAGGVSAYALNQQPATPAIAEAESGETSTPEPNVAPTASFSFLSVDGLTITVDGANSLDPDGELVTYEWAFGDGQTATGPTASNTYGDYGTYTVTLTVTDDAGATGVFSANVTLDAPPPPPAPEPPAPPTYTYGNYPPGYPMPNIPGTDQPDTSACASSTGTTVNGKNVCA